jgi:hypothetical protein
VKGEWRLNGPPLALTRTCSSPRLCGLASDARNKPTAASEVEIDVLTGETTVLRSDILIDIGHSLNPCLDVGQVEGAFVQGFGLMTTEQMMYEADGRLYSNGRWEYKPPCSKSIPVNLRVTIDKGGDPNQTNSVVMSSRGIGEPPLVLSASAFFAIKQAIMTARRDQGDDTWFTMPTPATVGRVRSHCRVKRGQCICDGEEPPAVEELGGAERDRTVDLLNAIQALSQLSYGPTLRGTAGRYGN